MYYQCIACEPNARYTCFETEYLEEHLTKHHFRTAHFICVDESCKVSCNNQAHYKKHYDQPFYNHRKSFNDKIPVKCIFDQDIISKRLRVWVCMIHSLPKIALEDQSSIALPQDMEECKICQLLMEANAHYITVLVELERHLYGPAHFNKAIYKCNDCDPIEKFTIKKDWISHQQIVHKMKSNLKLFYVLDSETIQAQKKVQEWMIRACYRLKVRLSSSTMERAVHNTEFAIYIPTVQEYVFPLAEYPPYSNPTFLSPFANNPKMVCISSIPNIQLSEIPLNGHNGQQFHNELSMIQPRDQHNCQLAAQQIQPTPSGIQPTQQQSLQLLPHSSTYAIATKTQKVNNGDEVVPETDEEMDAEN